MTQTLEHFRTELTELIRARFPIIHISTHEEDRAIEEIKELADTLGHKVMMWSASRGVYKLDAEPGIGKGKLGQLDLLGAIETLETQAGKKGSFIAVLLDPYPYLTIKNANPAYCRRLRDYAISIRRRGYHTCVITISPTSEIPLELEKEVTVLDFPLPGFAEIKSLVSRYMTEFNKAPTVTVEDGDGLVEDFSQACRGLTQQEIENVLARSLIDDRVFSENDVKKVLEHKRYIARKNQIIEYIDVSGLSIDTVGGLDLFKDWLAVRDMAFSQESREFGIHAPKGVLLTGVPGCGKSLSAKSVAASWLLPLLKLDMGRVFDRWVGSSEERLRSAIATCEAIAPCVLWIDEIEKGLPSANGNDSASGVGSRILGGFLTWLQEKTAPVFVFATANQIDLLPPELLRKGRFDEVFFVDLPSDSEREAIIRIHIQAVGRDPDAFDLPELVRLSGADNFGDSIAMTGAEIEAWVNEALMRGFKRTRQGGGEGDLIMEDFRRALAGMVPLAKLRAEEIAGMRRWAESHAVFAAKHAAHADAQISIGGRALDLG